MIITYRDELGIVEIRVNEFGISFADGYAYFSDEQNNDCRIDINDIIGIEYRRITR